ASKNRLVAHAGTARTTALRDRRTIEHYGLSGRETAGLRDAGVRFQSDAENLHRLIERKVERQFPFLLGPIFKEDMFDGVGCVLWGDRSGAVDAIDIQINSRLAEGMHVGHVRWRRVGKLDCDPRRISSKTDA